jgi:hypothetical protein
MEDVYAMSARNLKVQAYEVIDRSVVSEVLYTLPSVRP